jgi:hypothetical protein
VKPDACSSSSAAFDCLSLRRNAVAGFVDKLVRASANVYAYWCPNEAAPAGLGAGAALDAITLRRTLDAGDTDLASLRSSPIYFSPGQQPWTAQFR